MWISTRVSLGRIVRRGITDYMHFSNLLHNGWLFSKVVKQIYTSNNKVYDSLIPKHLDCQTETFLPVIRINVKWYPIASVFPWLLVGLSLFSCWLAIFYWVVSFYWFVVPSYSEYQYFLIYVHYKYPLPDYGLCFLVIYFDIQKVFLMQLNLSVSCFMNFAFET